MADHLEKKKQKTFNEVSVPTAGRPLVSLWQGKWLSPVLITVSIILNLTLRRVLMIRILAYLYKEVVSKVLQ